MTMSNSTARKRDAELSPPAVVAGEDVGILADIVHRELEPGSKGGCPDDGNGYVACWDIARAVLASPWLTTRIDAAVREARAEGAVKALREIWTMLADYPEDGEAKRGIEVARILLRVVADAQEEELAAPASPARDEQGGA